MTERSFFWEEDDLDTGDSELSPYTSAQMQEIWRILLAADDTEYAQIEGYHTGSGATLVTNSPDFEHHIDGNNSELSPGNAVAHGSPYVLNADIQIGYSYTGVPRYYTVVLRNDLAAQTVRLVTLGPQVGSYPTPVWNTYYHDIPIRRGYIVSAGNSTHYGTNRKMFAMNNLGLLFQRSRLGGSSTHWNTYGATAYPITVAQKIQTGTINFTDLTCCPVGSYEYDHDVVFPIPFTYNPIVLCNVQYLNTLATNPYSIALLVDTIATTGFTLHWRSEYLVRYTNIRFSWIAIGHIAEG